MITSDRINDTQPQICPLDIWKHCLKKFNVFHHDFFETKLFHEEFQETVQTVQTFLQCRASRMNWSIATINDENISNNVHCTTVIVIVNLLLGVNFMYFVRAGLLISFNFVSTVSTCYSLKLFFPILGVFYSRLFEETCTSILIVETKWEGMNENLITKWGRGSTIRGRRR